MALWGESEPEPLVSIRLSYSLALWGKDTIAVNDTAAHVPADKPELGHRRVNFNTLVSETASLKYYGCCHNRLKLHISLWRES